MTGRRAVSGSFFIVLLSAGLVMSTQADKQQAQTTLQVISMDPAPGTIMNTPPQEIRIAFNKVLDATSVSSQSVRLIRSGGDGVFNDGDEVEVTPSSTSLASATELVMNLRGVDLPLDYYQVTLSGETREGILRFDGVDDEAVLERGLINGRQTLTVEVFFRPQGPGVILGIQHVAYPSQSTSHNPIIYIGLDNRLRAEFWNGTTQPITNESPYNPNQWLHVSLVGDDNRDLQWLYIDGHLAGQVNRDLNIENMPFNQLGTGYVSGGWPSTPGNWFPFKGDIDEVRLWSTARTQAEIQSTLNESLTGTEPGLVAVYTFNKETGQVINDLTPQEHNGYLGSSPDTDASDPVRIFGLEPGSAIRDVEGGVLDGEYTGTLPSGDGIPGGYFNAGFILKGVTVQSPNGGEIWLRGTMKTITWVAPQVENVKIEASADGGGEWFLITPITVNDGQYAWEVPLIDSNRFRIRITDYADPTTSDTSDADFTVAQGVITITVPNGGERWPADATQTVRWTNDGKVGPVRIEASANHGVNWFVVSASASNTGTYKWRTPNIQSTDFLIRVTDADVPQITDVSDKVFSIYYEAGDPRADVNQDGFVDFRDILRIHDNWHKQVPGNPR